MRVVTPFVKIAGISLLRLPRGLEGIQLIQTDGSFKNGISRTAVWHPETRWGKVTKYRNHRNFYESEFCSILDGVKTGEEFVNLENDCLPIISCFINKKEPKLEYARYYYWATLEEAARRDWFAIRWISRKYNRADDLF